jgi:arsenate reductase
MGSFPAIFFTFNPLLTMGLFNLPPTFAFMKKIYHLGNCTTCQAIIKETGIDKKGFAMQDIKSQSITAAQLDEMKTKTGSYESLFSRRAMKYKEMGLKDKPLTEKDYRQLILEEYTFLKRPVVFVNDKVFVGSEKKTVEALKNILS